MLHIKNRLHEIHLFWPQRLTVQRILAMYKPHKGWGQSLQTVGLKGKVGAGLGTPRTAISG